MKYVYNLAATRRNALKAMAGAIVGFSAARLGWPSDTQNLPHLTDANPAAASLGYTEDAGSIDSRKFPHHKPEQRCANCKYFEIAEVAGGPYAPCKLYPGNAVNVNGWCAGYVAK
jgi:hypothetical protein